MKTIGLFGVIAFTVLCAAISPAQNKILARQRYSGWHHGQGSNYYDRSYCFRANANDADEQCQTVILKDDDRGWMYFYDPKTGFWWARCATIENRKVGSERCKELWEEIAAKDLKKAALADGPPRDGWISRDSAPPIPGSSDGVVMGCPPKLLPRRTDVP